MYQKEGNSYYTPDELGYQDRGMVKWQGFLLSDHNEQMEQERKDRAFIPPKLQQSKENRSRILADAYSLKREVAIQMNTLENGRYPKDLIGYVLGVEHEQLFLQTEKGIHILSIEGIRNISFTHLTKWYQ